ncbi:tyrosine-type recombinase/integrase [Notoacmeibacter ruber]|uniref:Site-specific integrase n=1 Tax=Notoacmeibacter ruber TaxID=2670375 RepID=A0A3L7J9B8_9HYPH|nr:site-specific integrase [Notoacmeibacter ruber]RLQ87079.1 site-specific integrase [Notoacmeibacter ruber]
MAKALTAAAVEKYRPEEARREIPDGGLTGLYLVIQPSGRKSWAVRYRHGGRPRKATIGNYPAFDLKAARDAGAAMLRAASEGRDPASEKAEAKTLAGVEAEDTIEKQVEIFLDRHVSRNRSSHEVERLLRKEVMRPWKAKRLPEITRGDVVRLLDDIVDRPAPYTANRVLANLNKFGNWCVSRGLIDANFCAGVAKPSSETKRDRVLNDRELALVWRAAGAMGFPFGPLYQLLVLTGQRREEVAGMRWGEIDLDNGTWTIPRERAKNDTAHLVHLSPPALDILKSVPRIKVDGRSSEYVFTTTGKSTVSGFSRAKAKLDEKIADIVEEDEADPVAAWRVHDLRRTAASGMAGLGIGVAVVEKVLNHTSGTFGGIVSVYQRHEFLEERRRALEAWAAHVVGLMEAKPSNVLEMKIGAKGN